MHLWPLDLAKYMESSCAMAYLALSRGQTMVCIYKVKQALGRIFGGYVRYAVEKMKMSKEYWYVLNILYIVPQR
jgi:hypothetical protein